jgi:hypothetical protein
VDQRPEGDGELASHAVSNGSSDQSANHGTNRQLFEWLAKNDVRFIYDDNVQDRR